MYELETHLDDWTSWAIDNGVKPVVVSFIRFRPALLHDFPQRDVNPSPRSWVEGVSDAIGVVPVEAEYETFKGAVGEGAAAEFSGFMKIERRLPNHNTIIQSPMSVAVPDDPLLYFCYALTGALGEETTTENFGNIVKFAERMSPSSIGVVCINVPSRKNPDLASHEAFTKWARLAHQDVLF